jgi:lysophospholipase L1-like esterase
MTRFPIQTALTIAAVGSVLAAAHWAEPTIQGPALADLVNLVDFGSEDGSAGAGGGTKAAHAVAGGPRRPAVLLDDTNGVLDHFYAALCRTEPDAVTRVVHYGDSPTTADLITGDIRQLLQKRFGNAGHGFILMDQPWAWYQHYGVKLFSFGWHATSATKFKVEDGLFGLGGVSFTGTEPARTRFVFSTGRHSRFEVWYMKQPGGGTLSVSSGDRALGEIDTSAEVRSAGFYEVEADPPAAELEVKIEQGTARAFGITAESGGRGVVYDSLGLNGGAISVLARIFGMAHWIEQLRHRNPVMVVINYGTNEADFSDALETDYPAELREAIRRVHIALPKASVLIMSPMDRGHWTAQGKIETMPTIPRIVGIQSRIARETHCAFFNTFEAMGGAGTIARWYGADPPLVGADLIHPHGQGAKLVASVFVKEILAGLKRYQNRMPVSAAGDAGAVQ